MKNIKRNLAVVALLIVSTFSFAQNLDEIVQKHIEAVGGKNNWAKVKTVKTELVTKVQAAEIKVNIFQIDKKAMRTNIAVMGMEGYSILTTTEGWNYMPFQGQTKAEAMTADDVKKAQDGLNIQDEFITYKDLGKKIEYLGKDDVDGTECFKIKMTSKDGIETTFYIDPSNYYVIKQTKKMTINGKEVEDNTSMSNFKKLPEGIVMPYSIVSSWGEATVTNITINPTIDEALFKPTVAPAVPATSK